MSVGGGVDPLAIVRPGRLGQRNIPMEPSEIELASFRLVAQCSTNSATVWPLNTTHKYAQKEKWKCVNNSVSLNVTQEVLWRWDYQVTIIFLINVKSR
jgi:hypothetical protein